MEKSEEAHVHIESIRRERFYIGREEKNPLAQIVHRTVNYLSEELYSKDVHFLMELIQNAEDNQYPEGVAPSLEFIITSKDLTESGAASTLMVCNNERGFSSDNIDSICGAGISTKKGNRHCGYIGEKGIGFKSVFVISSQPHIFSNGYQIRFNEDACPDCNIGYIVPRWVDENPTLSTRKQVYHPSKPLPTTTIILPLKPEKIQAVKQQLSKMHPEILLFLSKIRQLSVREHNENPELNTVSQISISSETDVQMRKNVDAESYTLYLASLEENEGEENECSYYMWKQKFPVKGTCRVDKRMEVDEWVITLAFPWGQRLNRGLTMPGIYAFLPTEMVTNFPFIIQADFLLTSSRESILVNSPWNLGILECVPSAFVNAFVSLVKSTDFASISSIFRFLPIKRSSVSSFYQKIIVDSVRLAIKDKILAEHIVPCESLGSENQKIFSRPNEVSRLLPDFRNILEKVQKNGVDLKNLSSHGTYILSSSFDREEYNEVLRFLGVGYVGMEWYGKCIKSSDLIREVSDEIYMDLLCFIADNWKNNIDTANINYIPLLKCTGVSGELIFISINQASKRLKKVCIAFEDEYSSWLISWNKVFASSSGLFFMSRSTQTCLRQHSRRSTLFSWLHNYLKVEALDVDDYGRKVLTGLGKNRSHTIAFAHFLYHSSLKEYMPDWAVEELCSFMPLVDSYGKVHSQTKAVLVPANGSNWGKLMGSNPWRWEKYVELGAEYKSSSNLAGNYTPEDSLLEFLRSHSRALDIPDLAPPNASFPTVSSSLTKENTFLLLQWLRTLRYRGVTLPSRFLDCIKKGSWLKTSVGLKAPTESFLPSSDWCNLLQMGDVPVHIPMINRGFYGPDIDSYKEELRLIGVRFEFGEASTYIGNHLMVMASSFTRGNVISLLKLIRFLREKQLSLQHLINNIKYGMWLKTNHGYHSPFGSVLFSSQWTTASYVSDLHFIDIDFYGTEILNYETELELLGVVVQFHFNHQMIVDNFRLSSSITPEATILILECIRYANSCEGFVSKLKDLRWVKTHRGYKTPGEAFLVDSELEFLLKVGVPLIDQGFYNGKIGCFKNELKKAGVLVEFKDASKAIASRLKRLLSSSSLTKKNIIALLQWYRQLKDKKVRPVVINCMRSQKWLQTTLGLRPPSKSILYDSDWDSVLPITKLPLIVDSDAFCGKEIHEYKNELKALGAVVKFEDGAHFVIDGLNLPKNPSDITPQSVLSLLKCVRYLKERKVKFIREKFKRRIESKWLKTSIGYKSPGNCILFSAKWKAHLQKGDGPFIDVDFYGPKLTAYAKELQEIGVIMEFSSGCSLLADNLKCHTSRDVITRIYMFLSEFKWEGEFGSDWIWIPNGSEGGKWVGPDSCVLHDNNNLFGSQLYVLDKYYDHKLHGFFSVALKAQSAPTVEDYCKLWRMWEDEFRSPTEAECSAFWVSVAKHWGKKTESFVGGIEKLPLVTGNGILLCNKHDVFIPDDLLLKDLFDNSSQESIFVWYPSSSLAATSRAKMNAIYTSLGARKISEAVKMDQSSISELKEINSKESIIKPGLIKLVLGFLSDPVLDISVKNKHQILKYLIDTIVFETEEPIAVSYSLSLSSGKKISVKTSRILRWEREISKLFIQKTDRLLGKKTQIEYATYFAEVISEGLLFERADKIGELDKLLKLGCLLDFDDDAVDFLMKSKNLEVFAEDEEFLSSEFSSLKIS